MVVTMAILRIPALIDPHVHMVENSLPGWRELASVAKKAGYAALQIMPDLDPPNDDKLSMAHYQQQSLDTAIPLYLTLAASPNNIDALKQVKTASAIKVWLGTGPEELIVTKEEELRQILLATDKIVMIHAEDEATLLRNYDHGGRELSLEQHGAIFDRTAAIRATVKAIAAAKETGRRIYLCHVSTAEEIDLIRKAKHRGLRIYAEVAPHHLFLTEDDLARLGTLGKVNPPLRTSEDQASLWEAVTDGTIDTIGSDSYLWYETEKHLPYEQAPSGLPNLELTLPLLITAVKQKRLTLQRVIELTSVNPARIFRINKPTRSLFVDMDNPRPIRPRLNDWHPYTDQPLVGWPVRQKENGQAISW